LIIGLAGFIIGWSVGWDVIPELVAMNERLEVGRYVIFQGELWQGSLGSTPVILKWTLKPKLQRSISLVTSMGGIKGVGGLLIKLST
jgi:hypothetical protein